MERDDGPSRRSVVKKIRDSVRSRPAEYAWDCGTYQELTMNEHELFAAAPETDAADERTGR
jgi:hypothetical protein